MRRTFVAAFAVVFAGIMMSGPAVSSRLVDFLSPEMVLRWINGYRAKPDPEGLPHAVKALSRLGAFKKPESAGVYVGFISGAIDANRAQAEKLIDKMFPLAEENHWVIVRAIAYSGHPDWKRLLREFAPRMPSRRTMIEKYLSGETPLLFQVASKQRPTMMQRVRHYVSYDTYFGKKKKPPREELEPSPELLDIYWGYYFATGHYRPIARILAMLPWVNDHDSVDKVSLGYMAKYTLATNAARDSRLRAMLKQMSAHQPKKIARVLKDVIDAAEMVETSRIRNEATAAIEELRRKGPAYRRNVSQWGQIGTGALAIGCVAAAATGQVELGLPCVLGGSLSSAALKYWESQQ
jgi:hypothetical protein